MKISIQPYIRYKLLMGMVIALLFAWAVTATVVAFKLQPQVILVGTDENGTRLITTQTDPMLSRERIKFIKEFLYSFYNYSSDDYEKAMNQAGGLMADSLWIEKEKELHTTLNQMKQTPLSQEVRLLDLREVADTEFEVDLGVKIQTRLQSKETKYRVDVKIGSRKRGTENPYPWEVLSVHETEIH